MIYANDEGGFKATATPGGTATCPCCDGRVIPKCGEVITWHWAHADASECDSWSEGETEWHREWKSTFKPEFVEVTVDRDGKRHRADVALPMQDVIEFQHSSISTTEIAEREEFYGSRLIWVWDARDAYKEGRLTIRRSGGKGEICWSHSRISITTCTRRVFLDCGEMMIHVKEFADAPFRAKAEREVDGRVWEFGEEKTVFGWGDMFEVSWFFRLCGVEMFTNLKPIKGGLFDFRGLRHAD